MLDSSNSFDVVVIGAGAAGLMCAAQAGQRGKRVLLVDHAAKLAEKIRISGGGRCNFTNLHAGPANFLSENPKFCRSALSRYTPQDFLGLLRRHGVGWNEKHKGQLFCDEGSGRIIDMLVAECDAGNVSWRRPCAVAGVGRTGDLWRVDLEGGAVTARSVVIATGGLSIPKIGATDFGLRLARSLDIKIVEPRPALVPLTFDGAAWAPFAELSGAALEVDLRCNEGRFREDLLLTHRGLSGPAILQISSYWQPGDEIVLDLAPAHRLAELFVQGKSGQRQHVQNVLADYLPRRLADLWAQRAGLSGKPMADVSDKALRQLGESINAWRLKPAGSEGYRKAEVMRGGVDTRELDQRSLMAKAHPGLHFIGEVVDVTGWLGGYNFQWAWASAVAAAEAVAQ